MKRGQSSADAGMCQVASFDPKAVAQARRVLPPTGDIHQTAERLAVLGNPARLALLLAEIAMRRLGLAMPVLRLPRLPRRRPRPPRPAAPAEPAAAAPPAAPATTPSAEAPRPGVLDALDEIRRRR